MDKLDLTGCTVRYIGNRIYRVENAVGRPERTSVLDEQLATATHQSYTGHKDVYIIIHPDCTVVYVFVADSNYIVGTSLASY